MKFSGKLTLASQIINVVIFFYFIMALIKVNLLDMVGLLIGAFGILASLISSIVNTLGEN